MYYRRPTLFWFTVLWPYNYILEFLDLNGERTRERILLEQACLVDTGSNDIDRGSIFYKYIFRWTVVYGPYFYLFFFKI